MIYTHSTGSQRVDVLAHNGEDLTQVRFDDGTETWVRDVDLSEAPEQAPLIRVRCDVNHHVHVINSGHSCLLPRQAAPATTLRQVTRGDTIETINGAPAREWLAPRVAPVRSEPINLTVVDAKHLTIGGVPLVSLSFADGRQLLGSYSGIPCTVADATTASVPAPINCDYGPAGEIATRITDSDEALCLAHAREHYGSEWKTETHKMGARALARLTAARTT